MEDRYPKNNIEGFYDYSQVLPKHKMLLGILGHYSRCKKSYKVCSETSGGCIRIPLVSVREVLIPI